MKIKYQSFDGVFFDTEAECKAYESKLSHVRVTGLTIEQVEAALAGHDKDLAEALEEIGTRIARARRARGELKRSRPADAAPAEPEQEPPPEPVGDWYPTVAYPVLHKVE